ncbi:FadR/GntR family transcriptional regulator [Haematomicrobium sanguinis]|uniref:FadR/GntR family transcriptional regulator n=1 Tax=Haematomicrobium sanguinis TaxID=479106 RepID=UPI00047876A1|nr:FCD domain-containing protein [Haematomicrobium sanguinis]
MKSHEQLLQWVEDNLRNGTLSTGQRLPSERDLAERLGMSRPSVREGVRILEAMGLVRAATGSGANAGTIITADPHIPLASALKLHLASATLPFTDIVQTRVLLETWAAEHADSAHPALQEAAEILHRMDPSATSPNPAAAPNPPATPNPAGPQRPQEGDPAPSTPTDFLALDAEFHVTLSAAAGNAVVHALMSGLRESVRHYTLESIAGITDWPELADRLDREHRAILDALIDGRREDAAHLLQAHIEGFYRVTHGRS